MINNKSFIFEHTDSLETNSWNAISSGFLGEGYVMEGVIDLSQEGTLQSKNVYYRLKLVENNEF